MHSEGQAPTASSLQPAVTIEWLHGRISPPKRQQCGLRTRLSHRQFLRMADSSGDVALAAAEIGSAGRG
jgi:hypothetical protein